MGIFGVTSWESEVELAAGQTYFSKSASNRPAQLAKTSAMHFLTIRAGSSSLDMDSWQPSAFTRVTSSPAARKLPI
jgi:hypothetical protein